MQSNHSNLGDTVATRALVDARKLKSVGRHGQALAYYLIALHSDQTLQEDADVTAEFVDVFCISCDQLLARNDMENLSRCYAQSRLAHPRCSSIYSHMGTVYYRLGHHRKALDSFTEALQYEAQCASTIENMDNIKCHMVDRWHFRMLNDKSRNSAFQQAIREAARIGYSKVLDIGSGSCLLSMMAVEGNYGDIYACDENVVMLDISEKVLNDNQMSGKVKVIAKNSTDLITAGPDADVDGRVNLIITETVDCGVFGERILSTLSHAWKNLLSRKGKCLIIPGRAVVYCCIIECAEIRRRHSYDSDSFGSVDLSGTRFVDVTSQPRDEIPDSDDFDPYTTYNLQTLKGGYRKLSEVNVCLDVNFNSEQNIDHLLAGHREVIEFKVNEKGTADAVAVWFDLYTDKVNFISSKPELTGSCWDQAIFPISTSSIQLVQGTVSVELLTVDNHMEFQIVRGDTMSHFQTLTLASGASAISSHQSTNNSIRHSESQNGLTADSAIKSTHNTSVCNCGYNTRAATLHSNHMQSNEPQSNGDSGTQSIMKNGHTFSKVYLKSEDIYRMNDPIYHMETIQAVSRLKDLRSSNHSTFILLDMSTHFSLLPIQAVHRGADHAYWLDVRSAYLQQIYSFLCCKNNVQDASVLSDREDCDDLDIDCVVCDPIDSDGTIKPNILRDVAYIKSTSVKRCEGQIIPGRLVIYGACINSIELMNSSCVLNSELTCGFDISNMNYFQTTTHRDIDMQALSYIFITHPQELLALDLNSEDVDKRGFPEFLNSERVTREMCIREYVDKPTEMHAVIYWFEMGLGGSHHVLTSDENTHYNQAAFMLPRDTICSPNDMIDITTRVVDGSLHISTKVHHRLD